MLEWIGLIPLLGLTGNWRGYRMGGKAIGGANMSTDMKKKFEEARAAGNIDEVKRIANKTQAFNDAKKAEKAAKTIVPPDTAGDVITLSDHQKKGIGAYMVPVSVVEGNIVRGAFANGKTNDYQRAWKGQTNNRTFDLSKSNDGWYEYQEAVSGRTYRGYVKVEKGKIVDEVGSSKGTIAAKQEFLLKVAPVAEMPALSGSSKQVSWAESIREKAVRTGKITASQAAQQSDSRWWIDNRSRF